ncbi:hypothetical protein ABAC402_11035 [Asticcacaulis sp. AC402]|nr:hypothetical protein ABAC402_11035 [Asticcacaulis sp. AC402]
MAIRIICADCGSDRILKDAYAEWDIETQEWVLSTTFDDNLCDACGGTTVQEEGIAVAESAYREHLDPLSVS